MSARRRPVPAGIQAPADRRYRRPDVRPGRRRRLGRHLWRVTRVVGVGLVAMAVLSWGGQVLLGSRLLDVSRIVVEGNRRLPDDAIESLVGGLRGQNILRVDFEQYRRRILDSPWVAGVTLFRLLPSTVEIRVVERIPMAIARLQDHLYLVDQTGVIIDDFGPEHHDVDLPIVDGLIRVPGGEGATVHVDRVHLASRFLASLDAAAELRPLVSQMDVTRPRDVAVLLDGDPAWLHLGDTRFPERLRAYLELAPMLRERFGEIEYVDLRFEKRVFVHAAGRTGRAARGASGG